MATRRQIGRKLALLLTLVASSSLHAQTGDNVLLVVNSRSEISKRIGSLYAELRDVPARNVCSIKTQPEESIGRAAYESDIEDRVAKCLKQAHNILYVATTKGVPLRIRGTQGRAATASAVDSELALLGRDERHPIDGWIENPYFRQRYADFSPEKHQFYPVTRLTGYNFEDVEAMLRRSLLAKNEGVVVLDVAPIQPASGNDWLKRAARALPLDRVELDRNNAVVYDRENVIAYAGWGQNDVQRRVDRRRWLGFTWLPGALAIEYVSTSARTFAEPPEDWTIGTWKDDPSTFFSGSPQSMTGDLIREGASAAVGHVYEPYLAAIPRPFYVLPAYLEGKPLAEAVYVGMPYLSWMNVVVGDPLMRLTQPD